MKKVLLLGLLIGVNRVYAYDRPINQDLYGSQVTIAVPVVNVSSLTLSANQVAVTSATAVSTGGTNLYNYITNIHIEAAYTNGVANASSFTVCTSSNMPGNPSWLIPPAISTGTAYVVDMQYANGLKSVTPNNVTSVLCPAQANTKYNINMGYYQSN